jgi:uncharacterized repeat protein (TIGR03803 family)
MKSFYCAALLFCLPLLSLAGISQTVNEVFSFSNANSSGSPAGPPTQGRDGKIYSTTNGFGRTVVTDGAVFRLSTGGKWTDLHSFTGPDGQNPVAGLTLAYDGNYYGTTSGGGSANSGVLFKIAPTGAYTVLYQFTGGSDGSFPAAPPILASDGNLYGTNEGGTNNNGTIYKYSPTSGTFTTILNLNSDGSQGSFIEAPLVQGADGNLYGTAPAGGASGCGTIFKVSTAGTLLQVYSFPCGAGGNIPGGTACPGL